MAAPVTACGRFDTVGGGEGVLYYLGVTGTLERIRVPPTQSASFACSLEIDGETCGKSIHAMSLDDIEWSQPVAYQIVCAFVNVSVNAATISPTFIGPGIMCDIIRLYPNGRITLAAREDARFPAMSTVPPLFRPLHPAQATTANEIEVPSEALFEWDIRSLVIHWKTPLPDWCIILN